MNIVLIGFRGTGKTVVGKKLAEVLNKRLVKMDELVTEKAGMSIPEIVERHGWDKFRDVESEVAEEVGKMDNCIIDTGGGVILREVNVHNLKKRGIIIWLKSDVKTIIERIKDDKGRPSLTGKKSFIEEVTEVLEQRIKKYEDAADYAIDTSRLTVDEVVDKIIGYLKMKGIL
ncbi:MAG: shikimate kinase [Candidatus Bathyarchaeia archaeon]